MVGQKKTEEVIIKNVPRLVKSLNLNIHEFQ